MILFIAVFGAMVPTAAAELELPREVGPEPVLEPGVRAEDRQQDQHQPVQTAARHGVRLGRVREQRISRDAKNVQRMVRSFPFRDGRPKTVGFDVQGKACNYYRVARYPLLATIYEIPIFPLGRLPTFNKLKLGLRGAEPPCSVKFVVLRTTWYRSTDVTSASGCYPLHLMKPGPV